MLKVDPITSLALSLESNPGVYALLIGSGVSSGASIPTGWGITQNLIGRLAVAQGEKTGGDAIAWFKSKYTTEPDYSVLLDELCDQGTRQAMLRQYFEPTPEEREEGKKLPTPAHKAIARLVRGGFARVIITTNFDHLLEDAIRAEGIKPSIVSTPDAIKGAVPLVHSKCFILKVHGDYLDVRFKNTREELESYDEGTDRLLDKILDDFGLIVCGWSADWDPALRRAILRCPNRRYATFWTGRETPTATAQMLIEHRAAKFIQIASADRLFDDLVEKVFALNEARTPNPTEVHLAIAAAKRYLTEDRHRIRLHDLIETEARNAQDRLIAIEDACQGSMRDVELDAQTRESACEMLLQVLATCGFHSRGDQRRLLRSCAEIVATGLLPVQGGRPLHPLLLHASAMAVYVTSLSAIAADQDTTAAEMLSARTNVWPHLQGRILSLLGRGDFRLDELTQPKGSTTYAPISEFIFKRCERLAGSFFVDRSSFERAYDRFEYINAIITSGEEDQGQGFGPYRGRWMLKAAKSARRGSYELDMRQIVAGEIERDGKAWPYLQASVFDGSLAKLQEAKELFDENMRPIIVRMR